MMNLNTSATASNLRAWACVEIFGRELTIEMDRRFFASAAFAMGMEISRDALVSYVEEYGVTPHVENMQSVPVLKMWFDAKETFWII